MVVKVVRMFVSVVVMVVKVVKRVVVMVVIDVSCLICSTDAQFFRA